MLKKALKISLLISFIGITILVGALFLTKAIKKEMEKSEREIPDQVEYQSPKIISEEKIAEKVRKKLKKSVDIYSMEYQKTTQSVINKLKKERKYTLNDPLLIVNPFGTNKTGLYIYFKHGFRVNTGYTVSIKSVEETEEKRIPDFSAKMFTNVSNLPLAEQEGQIVGLMSGKKNYVSIYLYDESGKMVGKAGYKILLPEDEDGIPIEIQAEHSREVSQLSEGLFGVFGLDSEREVDSLPFYDNNGILRARLRLEKGAEDVNLKFIDGKLFYSIDERRYALVNSLGKVEKLYDLGEGFKSFGDFDFTPANRYMLTFTKQNQKGNFLSMIDLYDGKSAVILDFATLFSEREEGLAFNSLCIVNDNDIFISEKNTSTVFRINNVFRRPEVKILLSSVGKISVNNLSEIQYEKKGDFTPHFLQSSVFMDRTQKIEERKYHLHVLNSRGGEGETILYDYLIDEGARSYSLFSSISLPKSSKGGGLGKNEGNTVISLGEVLTFYEYNADNNLLSTYKFKNRSFRKVLKFDLKGSWFAK